MKKYSLIQFYIIQKLKIFILLSLVIPATSEAQKINAKNHPQHQVEANGNCVYWPKYTPKQRLQFYPFNIADTVKIVSFRCHYDSLPINGNKIIEDSLIEQKVLKTDEVDVLTDILYNNFDREPSNIASLALCFEPRNAVLFFDKKRNLREYIIICFHCNERKLSSNKVEFGSECYQKMDKLRIFFMTNHLYFGTDLSVDSYLGETFNTDIVAPSTK